MIWRFGDRELDEGLYQLRRRGKRIPVEPKVFDVLLYLVQHRDRVVPKAELLDTLWAGEAVSDSVLPRCIAAARRAIGDDRNRQRGIQTVHGRGYRFVAPAREAEPEVAHPSEAAPAPQTSPSEPSSGFVGRSQTLALLRAALGEAFGGRVKVVLLVGEPGIGKTRTADELATEASRKGARCLVGRCYEGSGSPAFWPWLQVLRTLLTPQELDALLPRFSEVPVGDVPGLDGEQQRFRLFDGITRHLARCAEREPLVVLLDDLHWADPDSLRLLRFLSDHLRDSRVLVVASYRDVEVRREHPLRALLGELAGAPHCERIALRGLPRDEVAELIATVTGASSLPALVDAVADMTEGNPFFVREVISLLAEEGRLEDAGATGGAFTLPQGVRDAVGRRLDSLSNDCNALLRAASVIERDFDTRLLERIEAFHGDGLLELVGEAEAAEILKESPHGPGRFTFSHALVRQTLYGELRAPQRVSLHRRVGESLVELYGERPDAPTAQIAHHFFEAIASGTAHEAFEFSILAAERAHGQLAYEDSARHYERALDALDFAGEGRTPRRCELLIAWGDELRTAGSRDAGRERLAEAAEIARSVDRADLLARAAIGYRGFGEMGVPSDPETLSLMEEAREALGGDHGPLRAQLLARLTGTPPYAVSMAVRDELSREAWDLARDLEDPIVLTDALCARYWAALGPDRIEERLEVARDAKRLAERLGDRRIALIAHEVNVGAYLMLGDRQRIDAALAAHRQLAEELRQPGFLFISNIMHASRAMNLGDFDEAEEQIRRALERGRGLVPFAELIFIGQVFWLLQQKGEVERVAASMVEVGEGFRASFEGVGPLVDVLLAVGHLGVGEVDAARSAFEEIASSGFESLERDENWLYLMAALSELASEFQDLARAGILYQLLSPYADRMVSHDLLRTVAGSVHAALGRLAAVRGDPSAAVLHYEAALLKEGPVGARPAFHRSELGLAEALEKRGAAGDAVRAAELRSQGRSGLEALGCSIHRPNSP